MKYVYLIQRLTVPSQRYLARIIHQASAASTDTRLRRAVSLRVCALSRRTFMNIAGYGITANLDERLRVHNAGERFTHPNIILGSSCCISAFKMNNVRVNLNDISNPDQGMPVRTSVSREPSCPPTSRD